MIAFYNAEVARFAEACRGVQVEDRPDIDGFITVDRTRISWERSLKQRLAQGRTLTFDAQNIVVSVYRPFTKQWLYFDRRLNAMVYQMFRFFPGPSAENRVIMIKQRWSGEGHLALIVDKVADLQPDGGAQCFPLYLYTEENELKDLKNKQATFFESGPAPASKLARRDAITDEAISHFRDSYGDSTISKEDLFYYVYGMLHSASYRERFAANLAKEIPQIPCVATSAHFWHFSNAGRELADLHVNFETASMYPLELRHNGAIDDQHFRVEKMRYGRKGKERDLTVLHYNDNITALGVPLEAYRYVVNGKPALDWIVERQRVSTDQASEIINDANSWANENMHNPRYPLELFQRIITVSLETIRIVDDLPSLEEEAINQL